MKNLVISYASGPILTNEAFDVFVNSFRNVTNADLVFVTHDMNEQTRTRLQDRGAIIYDVSAGENYYIFRDRHKHFYDYLCKHHDDYKYVLVTDSRDVVFQANPFDWMEAFSANALKENDVVVVTAEGFKRQESGFACIEHFEFQRDVPLPYLQNDNKQFVCNAGVTLGTMNGVKSFELLMFMVAMKTIGRCTDQAALNYMLEIFKIDPMYKISYPHSDNLCLTGEGVRMGSIEPILSNKKLYNPKNELYYMVHQWDRLDGLREDILDQYCS